MNIRDEFLARLKVAGLNDKLARKVVGASDNRLSKKIVSLITRDDDGTRRRFLYRRRIKIKKANEHGAAGYSSRYLGFMKYYRSK